jgi:hypothetical protein
LENLGPAQKTQIIRRCVVEAERLISDRASRLDGNAVLVIYPLNAIRLAPWLAKDAPWAKMAILSLCSTLLRLAELKRLDAYSLNELGTLARGCIESVDSGSRYVETIILACETFEQIGVVYATPASRADVLVVRGVQQQLESLEKWFASSGKRATAAEARLSVAVDTVKKITVPEHFERLEKLTWPTIP